MNKTEKWNYNGETRKDKLEVKVKSTKSLENTKPKMLNRLNRLKGSTMLKYRKEIR